MFFQNNKDDIDNWVSPQMWEDPWAGLMPQKVELSTVANPEIALLSSSASASETEVPPTNLAETLPVDLTETEIHSTSKKTDLASPAETVFPSTSETELRPKAEAEVSTVTEPEVSTSVQTEPIQS